MTDSVRKLWLSGEAKPFALAAAGWVAVGIVVCWIGSSGGVSARANIGGFLGLWVLSLCNLLALGKTVKEILGLVTAGSQNEPEKRLASAIRAFSWGTVKLVCLGIFVMVLLRDARVSLLGRVLGAATFVVVPLLGGLGAVTYE